MNKIFEIPGRLSSVMRWSGTSIIGYRNSGCDHAFQVSFFAIDLYTNCNLKLYIDKGDLIEYCLIHDLPEIVTGDIPAYIKQEYPDIKDNLKCIENDFYLNQLPNFIQPFTASKEIKWLCKVADYMAIYLELKSQIELNNKSAEIIKAIKVVKLILEKLELLGQSVNNIVYFLSLNYLRNNGFYEELK